MDLTTLTYILIGVIAFLGFDAAMHTPDAIIEAEVVGSFDKTTINSTLANDLVTEEVYRISATPTVMTQPVIRVGRLEGLAMSLAESMKLQAVAYAFQGQLGYKLDQIKISLFGEGGTAKALITGTGRQRMTTFKDQVTLQPDETITSLLERAAVVAMTHVDPYLTALSEMQRHAEDKDFRNVETIITYATASQPPSPVNFQRCLFENLTGLLALFKADATTAHDWFERAEASCPDESSANAVVVLNLAFADLQLDRDAEAVRHLEHLLHDAPPTDSVLLSTTYMTLAAGLLGSTHDVDGADQAIAKAIQIYPEGSTAYELWADIKREKGEPAASDRLHMKALENSIYFENYSEIAALYFRLAWRENQPVMRSPYVNPALGTVHKTKRQ